MLSLVIASALVRQQDEYKSFRKARGQPMIFCAILTTLCLSAVGEPKRDAVGQDALNCRAVIGHQQLLTDVHFPKHSQEVQVLLCLLDDD